MSRVLCRFADIPDGEGHGVEQDGDDDDIIVVRQGSLVHGYVNVCPHTATPLDWVEHQFMSPDKSHIMCVRPTAPNSASRTDFVCWAPAAVSRWSRSPYRFATAMWCWISARRLYHAVFHIGSRDRSMKSSLY